MLEKPDLPDGEILACLQADYGLRTVELGFLPLGADVNTAVYRAVAGDGTAYFVKLRRRDFSEIAVTLPRYLYDQGLSHVIPPLAGRSGSLWAEVRSFRLILYPFVPGRNGYGGKLTPRHWRELGAALRRIHTAAIPAALLERVPCETFAPDARQSVRMSLERAERETFADPAATRAAAILRARRERILDLLERSERIAAALRADTLPLVVCHSDVHPGNLLIGTDDRLYIVDWDNPIRAPKERDLMFAGGGQGFGDDSPEEEERLFYGGYGPADSSALALAYYRYERILSDIAAFCGQLLGSTTGGEDRAQSVRYLESNFDPGGTVDVAYRMDRSV